MSTAQIREELHEYLNKADARFIHLVYGMMKEDVKGATLYTVQGKSLNLKQYKQEIDAARKQYENGEYVTHDELEKRSKNW